MAPIFGYLASDGQPFRNPVREGLPTIRELIGSVNTAVFFILQWIG